MSGLFDRSANFYCAVLPTSVFILNSPLHFRISGERYCFYENCRDSGHVGNAVEIWENTGKIKNIVYKIQIRFTGTTNDLQTTAYGKIDVTMKNQEMH